MPAAQPKKTQDEEVKTATPVVSSAQQEQQVEETETTTETQNMEPVQKEPTISFPTADFGGSKKSGKGKVVAAVVVILVSLGTIVGGSFFYYTQRTQNSASGTPKEEATPTLIPTPTPEESAKEIDLSEYNARVLNGSGIVGEAAKIQALLEKAGMEDIETGNAETYDFTNTEVQLVADSPSGLYATVQNALVGYSVKRGADISEDSDFDMIITVGSKKSSATTTPAEEKATEE